MSLDKNQIAKRIAQELKHNTYVNLGIGIPTLVANYIPNGIDVEFQSENGVLGMGPFPLKARRPGFNKCRKTNNYIIAWIRIF